jgi:hypothetical protein
METTPKEKGKKEGKTHRPDPEEQEGMQQHQDCPHAKHCEIENLKHHEEQ